MYKYLTPLLILIYSSCLGAGASSYPIKETPVSGDFILMMDSEAGNVLKRASFSTFPFLESSVTLSNFSDILNSSDYTPTGDVDLSGANSLTMGPIMWEGATVDEFQVIPTIEEPTQDNPLHFINKEMRVPAATTVDATGTIITAKIYTSTDADAHTLTYDEYHGGTVVATGAGIYTLPSASAGLSGCIETGQGVTAIIQLLPASGDYISYRGSRGTVATSIKSGGALGDRVCYYTVDSDDWYISTYGAWAE